MNKLIDIAVKHLRETIRQPKNLGLTLGLPVVFMVIFGLAFGSADENETFTLAVVNHDEGTLGTQYLSGLASLTYRDGTPLLRLTNMTDEAGARAGLETRNHDALLVIPGNFSADATPTQRPLNNGPLGTPSGTERVPPAGASVTVLGDPAFVDYTAVERIVSAYTEGFNAQISGSAPPVSVAEDFVTSQELTFFDHIAPGLMVFAILNIVPQSASMLARESELGTLDRFRQSPSRAFSLLGGVALAQLAIASVSLFLMLAAAKLMGFHNQGSYVVAYVIALGAAFAVIGIGMLVAAFVKSQQEAANFGTLIAVPGSFLSGAFFDIPGFNLFTWGDRSIGIYDLLPTSHAVYALRQVLTFGRGWDAIGFSATALVVLAALFLIAGIVFYRRNRLAPS